MNMNIYAEIRDALESESRELNLTVREILAQHNTTPEEVGEIMEETGLSFEDAMEQIDEQDIVRQIKK